MERRLRGMELMLQDIFEQSRPLRAAVAVLLVTACGAAKPPTLLDEDLTSLEDRLGSGGNSTALCADFISICHESIALCLEGNNATTFQSFCSGIQARCTATIDRYCRAAGPVISGVSARNVSQTTADIGWALDQPGTGQVDYGTTTSYGRSTNKETSLRSAHVQTLSALTPGTLYHFRVRSLNQAGAESVSGDFTFSTGGPQCGLLTQMPAPFPEAGFTYEYTRQAWNDAGRKWLTSFAGVNYNAATGAWTLDPAWADAPTNVAQQAYYLEYALRPAVNMGVVRRDGPLLEELARFLIAYEARFTTVGALRAQTEYDTSLLPRAGPNTKRTLEWLEARPAPAKARIRECTLCNGQFYHPIARWLTAVASMPVACRSTNMVAAATFYARLLAQDWLMWELYGTTDRLSKWRAIGQGTVSGNYPGSYFSDNDMWVLGAAAEVLGAHEADSALVPLTASEQTQLKQAVAAGVSALAHYVTRYPDTLDFSGRRVGSVSYFNGMFSNYPDYAYAGYTGQVFPTATNAKTDPTVSWDISHFYRFPVVIRSLRDHRAATGVAQPTDQDITLTINHLLYKTFQGDLRKPLFNNFFNGSNGWFRVAYNGRVNTGYAPAQYCDSKNKVGVATYFCLYNPGALVGWGLLASLSPDLMELQHSFLKLAWSQDPQLVAFKERYYTYDGYAFSPVTPTGGPQHPPSLLWVLGGVPEKLR